MAGDDDLLATLNVTMMACLLLLQRRRSRNAPRRYWVHPLWRYRDTEGQAHTLLPRLRARDEVYFRDFLRMPPRTFDTLLSLVGPLIERRVTPFRLPISAHERLAMTLRFLANGDTFRSLSFNFLTGRSTAGEIVRETTAVLWHVLQPLYMKFPQTTGEWKRIAADMEEFWNFPNCLGSIDGKHVIIECPRNTGSRNLNYKKTFSVVFLAVCDAHYRFTYVDMGHFGGEGDSGIFLRSRLLDCFNRRLFGVPPPSNVGSIGLIPYVLVGDEAFPLKTFMMRPYPQRGKFRCACAAQFLS
nr:protein ALP1-like [Rhipicephalus microplus]